MIDRHDAASGHIARERDDAGRGGPQIEDSQRFEVDSAVPRRVLVRRCDERSATRKGASTGQTQTAADARAGPDDRAAATPGPPITGASARTMTTAVRPAPVRRVRCIPTPLRASRPSQTCPVPLCTGSLRVGSVQEPAGPAPVPENAPVPEHTERRPTAAWAGATGERSPPDTLDVAPRSSG